MKIKTRELSGAALDWAVGQAHEDADLVPVAYSTDWAHAGPIIERDGIGVDCKRNDNGEIEEWVAYNEVADDENWDANVSYGPTPLIAAMRCFVSSHLGDEVDIPNELTQGEATCPEQ